MHYIFTIKSILQSQPKAGYIIIYTLTLYHNNPLKRREPTTNERERYTIILCNFFCQNERFYLKEIDCIRKNIDAFRLLSIGQIEYRKCCICKISNRPMNQRMTQFILHFPQHLYLICTIFYNTFVLQLCITFPLHWLRLTTLLIIYRFF